jgi:crotonobetainyl-CoA:carnitine CoA-transferase CaiB-like acyl-CoA transferase
LERLQAFDVPFSPANEIPQVFDDPQVRHLDSFMTLEHRDKGRLTSIRRPVLIDGRRDDQPTVAPPVLGEHTEAVLRELGLFKDEVVDQALPGSDSP